MQVFGQGLVGTAMGYVHYDYGSAVYPMDLGPNMTVLTAVIVCVAAFAVAVAVYLFLARKRRLERKLDAMNTSAPPGG